MRRFYLYASLLIFAGALVSSCLKENTDDCPPETPAPGAADRLIRVFFDYDDPSRSLGSTWAQDDVPRTRALDSDDVDYIDLFVFDANGVFLFTVEEDHPDITEDYHIPLELEAGNYQLVTWVNLKDEYELSASELVAGKTTIDELVLSLMMEGDTITGLSTNLFFGQVSEIEVSPSDDHDFLVPLVRNTYVINLETRGFPRNEDDYHTTIVDPNNKYDFRGQLLRDVEIYYKSHCDKDDAYQLHSSITVLGLSEALPDPVIKLKRTADMDILFEDNLIDLILGLRRLGVTVDFSKVFVYDILLIFNSKMEVTVNINGWNVIEDGIVISI